MDANDARYKYEKHGVKGARVGQAVSDILAKDQPTYTAGEILEGFGMEFAKHLEVAVNDGLDKYEGIFYVLALTKKEYWADNVVRNWFIPRQSAPFASDLIKEYPNHTKTLYVVNPKRGDIKVAWSIPAHEDCKAISRNPTIHAQELVKWVEEAYSGKLDIDKYDYLFS